MRLLNILTLPLLSTLAMPVTANTLEDAKKAFFYRDYQVVEKVIKNLQTTEKNDKSLMAELRLLSIAIDIHKNKDGADEELKSFLKENPNNASFHYMAGRLWFHIAKNSSIFSKMPIYKKHVAANIKAAELEPENERYQYVAAKAYGQPSMMGGDSDKQKPIVDKLMVNNSEFAQMAMMDYLQNTQDKDKAIPFINRISKEFKNNIEVLERAGQLLWTFDKKQQAGQLFSAVCSLEPGEYEAYVKWNNACLMSAAFATDGDVNRDVGLTSVNRLIKFSAVKDEVTEYAVSLKEELSN